MALAHDNFIAQLRHFYIDSTKLGIFCASHHALTQYLPTYANHPPCTAGGCAGKLVMQQKFCVRGLRTEILNVDLHGLHG